MSEPRGPGCAGGAGARSGGEAWFGAKGGPAIPEGAVAESDECLFETEVSEGSEIVETALAMMEINGKSGGGVGGI